MSSRRHPDLDGLSFVEPVGTGGFADVYLYEQAFPARRVAVKVLREASDRAGLEQFQAEANVMAQLSGHPSIVPIYQADVSADGRAYLVMEYCPPPHLAQRFRVERLPVADVLEIAVKIASAVETAHRAGILHRDIKPHNILTSTYGAPLLTDFGIASAMSEGTGEAYAMSVPWSPPEAFREAVAPDVRSDVFSLAATMYSLLAGRSPFEIPGGANDNASLIHRIERQDVSRVLRPDVPDSLNALLARSMSRRMEDRPRSAMAFARAVQEVQIELHLPPTRLEVMDASPQRTGDLASVDDARTEVKPIAIIIPDQVAERGTLLRPRSVVELDDRTERRPDRRPVAPDTRRQRASLPVGSTRDPQPLRDPLPGDPLSGPAADEPNGTRRWTAWLGIVAALVVIAVVVGVLVSEPEPADRAPEVLPSGGDAGVIVGGPASPDDLSVRRRGGQVELRWTSPDPQPGDLFLVEAGPSLTGLVEVHRAPEASALVEVGRGEQLCLSIRTIRSGAGSAALEECVVVP